MIQPGPGEVASIGTLIANSSIGLGLANIRENGIEAELEQLDHDRAVTTKKKRKTGKSPSSRTLEECRERGWAAGVVERFVRFPPPGHRVDLYGCIDIVAVVPGETGALGIQASPGNAHAAHRTKILKLLADANHDARKWLAAGNRLELWSWSKQGARGKQKRWTLRVETYAEMVSGVSA